MTAQTNAAHALVTLRTGEQVPHAAVAATMVSLRVLWAEHPFVALDLMDHVRDDAPLTGTTARALQLVGLITADRLHPYTRAVILAAVEVEEFDLRLVDPVTGGAA